MYLNLEKVDQVMKRANVDHHKAKEALDKSDWNILEAVIIIEAVNTYNTKDTDDFLEELIKNFKDLLKYSNVNRVIIEEKSGRQLVNVPVSLGAFGIIFLTSFTFISLIAALASSCTIKVIKDNGEIINVNKMTYELFKN